MNYLYKHLARHYWGFKEKKNIVSLSKKPTYTYAHTELVLVKGTISIISQIYFRLLW